MIAVGQVLDGAPVREESGLSVGQEIGESNGCGCGCCHQSDGDSVPSGLQVGQDVGVSNGIVETATAFVKKAKTAYNGGKVYIVRASIDMRVTADSPQEAISRAEEMFDDDEELFGHGTSTRSDLVSSDFEFSVAKE